MRITFYNLKLFTLIIQILEVIVDRLVIYNKEKMDWKQIQVIRYGKIVL